MKILSILVLSFFCFSCTKKSNEKTSSTKSTWIQNDQNSPTQSKPSLSIDEAETIINEILAVFKDLADYNKATLGIEPRWDVTADGYAARIKKARKWRVSPTKGVLKPGVTKDVLTLLTCHELGHIFGGFPFHSLRSREFLVNYNIDDFGSIGASEGQANYYATKDCLPRLWGEKTEENSYFALIVPKTARQKCDSAWKTKNQRDLCYRILVTTKEALKWYFNSSVSFDTPDPNVIDKTRYTNQKNYQCKFDIYVAGALCPVKNPSFIPGIVLSPNGIYHQHSVASEKLSKPYACHGDHPGARPACWFKPDMPDIDCSKFPVNGKCENGNRVICRPKSLYGIKSTECKKGCALYDENLRELTGKFIDKVDEKYPYCRELAEQCVGIPEEGKCEGNTYLTCDPRVGGLERKECEYGCALFDYDDNELPPGSNLEGIKWYADCKEP